MKFYLGAAIVILLTFNSFGFGFQDRCGGGDGPRPFNDISGSLPYHVSAVDTVGQIKEFLVWSKNQTVVYRNQNNEIRGIQTNNGEKKFESHFGNSTLPIDRIADDHEETFLTRGAAWLFDRLQNGWRHFSLVNPLNHLFWKGSKLYSYQQTQDNFEIFRYSRNDGTSKSICSFGPFSRGPVRLAHGHAYPHMVFYSDKPTEEGKELEIYLLDVEKCQFSYLSRKISFPVLSVYYFANAQSFGVLLDRPEANLFWWTKRGCSYYSLKSASVAVLDYKDPIFASWDTGQDLSLFFLNSEKLAQFKLGSSVTALTESDLWFSLGKKELLLATQFDGEQNKSLMRLKINLPLVRE